MNTAVVGSRKLKGQRVYEEIANYFHTYEPSMDTIVSGGAQGVDSEAAAFARHNGFGLLEFRPDWSLGKGAGYIRNVEIVENCDAMLAIWDGESRGTSHSINTATREGKPVHVIKMKPNSREDGTCVCDEQPCKRPYDYCE